MSGKRSSGRGARTLAEQLRGWPDDRLSRLLHERPDLATPVPHDSAQLAARAATRSSVLRALDQLALPELYVLDALVVSGETGIDGLAAIVNASADWLATTVQRLTDLNAATRVRPDGHVIELGRARLERLGLGAVRDHEHAISRYPTYAAGGFLI